MSANARNVILSLNKNTESTEITLNLFWYIQGARTKCKVFIDLNCFTLSPRTQYI